MVSNQTPATVLAAAVAVASPAEPNWLLTLMHIAPPMPPRTLLWGRRIFALAMLGALTGCSTTGDFGEVRPMLVRDDIHDWVGRDATFGIPSQFELTDDERQLRDLAYPLIQAPYDRQQPYSVAMEYGAASTAGVTRTSYANYLLSSRYRSPTARYAQMTEDIRNDITRLPQFFETAGRVIDLDQKRRKSLAYVSSSPAGEREEAFRRIRENTSLVSLVRTRLAQRVAAYRYALERVVVMTPSPQAIEVEQAVNRLQSLIAHYRNPPRLWVREQSLASAR